MLRRPDQAAVRREAQRPGPPAASLPRAQPLGPQSLGALHTPTRVLPAAPASTWFRPARGSCPLLDGSSTPRSPGWLLPAPRPQGAGEADADPGGGPGARVQPPPGHEFKKAKADGSEPGGSGAAALGASVHGGCGGFWAPGPASTRRGQATSSMSANRDVWLPLGPGPDASPPFRASEPAWPCSGLASWSLGTASLGSAFLGPPRAGTGRPPRAGGAAGPLGEGRTELRGWRNSGAPARGRASVSRSAGPTRGAAGRGSAGGLRAACCRQEASKCLRIWAGGRGLVRAQWSWGPRRAHPLSQPSSALPRQGPLGGATPATSPLLPHEQPPCHRPAAWPAAQAEAWPAAQAEAPGSACLQPLQPPRCWDGG